MALTTASGRANAGRAGRGDLRATETVLRDLVDHLDTLSTAELGALNGVTAGTVTASKAVVVDSNKDAAAFRNVTVTNLDAGASGTAGTVDVFPSTASRGKLQVAVTNQTGDTTVTLQVGAMGQATSVTIPDPGAAASYVMQTTAAKTLVQADKVFKYYLTVNIADISTETSYYVNGGDAGTISKIWAIVDGAFITADWTITTKIATVSVTNGLVTVTQAASAAGTTGLATPTAANTITAGQGIELVSSGAGAGAQRGTVTIEITRT